MCLTGTAEALLCRRSRFCCTWREPDALLAGMLSSTVRLALCMLREPAQHRCRHAGTVHKHITSEAHCWVTYLLQDRDLPIIFSMARLDRVKNLTGLAEWYGRCERLRKVANLVIVGGVVDPSQTHVGGCWPLKPTKS